MVVVRCHMMCQPSLAYLVLVTWKRRNILPVQSRNWITYITLGKQLSKRLEWNGWTSRHVDSGSKHRNISTSSKSSTFSTSSSVKIPSLRAFSCFFLLFLPRPFQLPLQSIGNAAVLRTMRFLAPRLYGCLVLTCCKSRS